MAAEATKATRRAELERMPALPPVLDTDAIVAGLKEHASNLVGLLAAEHGPRVRAFMRKLIPEPLTAEAVTVTSGL